MIISCEKCSKKFNLEDSLIPDEGRELQCGNCNYKWFFKKIENITKLENDVPKILSTENIIKENYIKDKILKTDIEKVPEKKSQDSKISNKIKKNKDNPKIVKNTLVFIISFVAIIILMDTFKFQLNNYFPGLDSLLNNLYESLKDISLFFNDLIN
tara:strand:+ start:34 stop:501 length:468 start_codon:yes stop_codon:yes gene_type:complete